MCECVCAVGSLKLKFNYVKLYSFICWEFQSSPCTHFINPFGSYSLSQIFFFFIFLSHKLTHSIQLCHIGHSQFAALHLSHCQWHSTPVASDRFVHDNINIEWPLEVRALEADVSKYESVSYIEGGPFKWMLLSTLYVNKISFKCFLQLVWSLYIYKYIQ